MNADVVVLLGVVVVAAAVYSTWSPCGQSMLSQLNPMAERARGQRYATTATWFILGSIAGGATLGVGMAALAGVARAASLGSGAAAGAAALVTLAAAALDARLLPVAPPFIRRQVNENWLPRYRGWLYGVGFGWQIGAAVTTYVMTTAVFAMIVLGVLTASPVAAFAAAVGFGVIRGAAVLLTARCDSFERLGSLHRRFDVVGVTLRRVVIGVEVLIAAAAATWAWGWAGLVAVVAAATVGLLLARTSRHAATAQPSTPGEFAATATPR